MGAMASHTLSALQEACADYELFLNAEKSLAEAPEGSRALVDPTTKKLEMLTVIKVLVEILKSSGDYLGKEEAVYTVATATKLFLLFRNLDEIAKQMKELLQVYAPNFTVDDLKST